MTQLSYFAKDGNYGDANGIVVVDTTAWTTEDFELMDQASDENRPTLARLISEWIDDGRTDKFDEYFARLGIDRDTDSR